MIRKRASLAASGVRMIKSANSGGTYRITIALPYAYSGQDTDWPYDDPPARWPVVYLLDADFYMGMVTELIRSAAWCGGSTDAIVVGISYPEHRDPQRSWRNTVARRATDLTPVRDETYERDNSEVAKRPFRTGNAAAFHAFIRDELIALIEAEYRADASRRILVGHSLGGLFGAFALLHEPKLFDAYVIGSPSLPFGDGVVFRQEEAFARKSRTLRARVYLYAGELDDDELLAAAVRFAEILERRSYKGLTLSKQIFANLNHCEVLAPGFQGGLSWALRK
jgi:predicted alpha/beta superfamily hydrolase